jgi:hypothetical protein
MHKVVAVAAAAEPQAQREAHHLRARNRIRQHRHNRPPLQVRNQPRRPARNLLLFRALNRHHRRARRARRRDNLRIQARLHRAAPRRNRDNNRALLRPVAQAQETILLHAINRTSSHAMNVCVAI